MPFSVIGVTETWLTDCTAELVNITGYNFVSNHCKLKTGSRAGIYLQNGLEYKLLKECKFSDPDIIESLFLEIIVPHGKKHCWLCVQTTKSKHCYVYRQIQQYSLANF